MIFMVRIRMYQQQYKLNGSYEQIIWFTECTQNSAQTVTTILDRCAKSIQFVHAQCTQAGNCLEIEFIS